MTSAAPSTLFDRMVARTIDPQPAIESPFKPLFSGLEEEVTETVTTSTPIVAREQSPFESAIRLNQAPTPRLEQRPEPQEPRAQMEIEPVASETRLAIEPVARPEIAVTRVFTPQAAPQSHPRVIRESRTIERLRLEQRAVSPTPLVEPREILSEPPAAFLSSGESRHADAPPVTPDLPVRLPLSPGQPETTQLRPETTIHVTIGRLEIRQNEREKPAPRPRPRGEHLSLEQYLARRGESPR